jgi:hypothetical protein
MNERPVAILLQKVGTDTLVHSEVRNNDSLQQALSRDIDTLSPCHHKAVPVLQRKDGEKKIGTFRACRDVPERWGFLL